MDEQEQSQQALMEMFRRDRAEAQAHPPRKPRWELGPLTLPWLIGIAVVLLISAPTAIMLIYPRFGPVDTMTSFCQAVADGEYATAYGLLSQGAQQRESLAAFTRASSGDNLVSCTVNGGIPFIFGGTQSTLDVQYNFDINGNASGVDGTMAFVRESGGWRVDSTSPVTF